MKIKINLFLRHKISAGGILKKRRMRKQGNEILSELTLKINLRARVKSISRADQQMTEIAKALLQKLNRFILKEPTASLTEHETEKLFNIVQQLKNNNVGIIYVTHRIAEIRELADRITVLRDGKMIGTVNVTNVK